MRLFLAGCATVVVASLAACGGSPGSSPTTVTETTTTTTTATTSSTTPSPGSSPAEEKSQSAAAKPTSGAIVVPNAVGRDYQSAQDLWRAAGLHVAPAIDATGAHRLPLIDSNWVVLSQDPRAGSKVQAGSFITATVKKVTDS
jgi:beta-lactam-binding protein with PASTA domain